MFAESNDLAPLCVDQHFRLHFVHHLANFLGMLSRPIEVRRVELDAFVPDLADAADCSEQIFLHFVTDRVEFQADRNGLAFLRRGSDVPAAAVARNDRRVNV